MRPNDLKTKKLQHQHRHGTHPVPLPPFASRPNAFCCREQSVDQSPDPEKKEIHETRIAFVDFEEPYLSNFRPYHHKHRAVKGSSSCLSSQKAYRWIPRGHQTKTEETYVWCFAACNLDNHQVAALQIEVLAARVWPELASGHDFSEWVRDQCLLLVTKQKTFFVLNLNVVNKICLLRISLCFDAYTTHVYDCLNVSYVPRLHASTLVHSFTHNLCAHCFNPKSVQTLGPMRL